MTTQVETVEHAPRSPPRRPPLKARFESARAGRIKILRVRRRSHRPVDRPAANATQNAGLGEDAPADIHPSSRRPSCQSLRASSEVARNRREPASSPPSARLRRPGARYAMGGLKGTISVCYRGGRKPLEFAGVHPVLRQSSRLAFSRAGPPFPILQDDQRHRWTPLLQQPTSASGRCRSPASRARPKRSSGSGSSRSTRGRGDSMAQLTWRAVLMGSVLGGVLSLTNLYIGLKAGWGFGVAITACILSYAIWTACYKIGLAQDADDHPREQLHAVDRQFRRATRPAARWSRPSRPTSCSTTIAADPADAGAGCSSSRCWASRWPSR